MENGANGSPYLSKNFKLIRKIQKIPKLAQNAKEYMSNGTVIEEVTEEANITNISLNNPSTLFNDARTFRTTNPIPFDQKDLTSTSWARSISS